MAELQGINDLEKKILKAIEIGDVQTFRSYFLDIHPYEQSQFFEKLPKDIRIKIYPYLAPEEMAQIVENLEIEEQEEIITDMEPSFVAEMLTRMYADDAVDVLSELKKEQVVSYLTMMDEKSAKPIKQLLNYEEKTAGSIMTTELVAIKANQTVESAMKILKREAPEAETIYYVFVIDDDSRLVGVISLRDLIVSNDEAFISEVMNERVVSVSVSESQETVAKLMKDYDFLALPVIDFKQHLLGIITVDDIIDVMDEEASKEYSKFAAVSDASTDRNPFISAKKRLPWLIILMFLGMMTANLIGRFEETLDQVAILAVFIPLIAGMAGNTGTQALAVAVRGIATGEIKNGSKWSLILREAGTGIITGTTCGILVTLIIFLWKDNIYLGILVGFSILTTLIIATLAGALVPLLVNKLNIDPAVASGPFITTINDIISILIYFGMATLFMNYLTH